MGWLKMSESAQVKVVLFDLDDTLFDHRYSSRSGLLAVQERYSCFQQATIDELEHARRKSRPMSHLKRYLHCCHSLE